MDHERIFHLSMRWRLFLLSFGVAALIAPSASAALKKYDMTRQFLAHYGSTSPNASFTTSASVGSVALIDDSGAEPVLAKFALAFNRGGQTIEVPGLTNGFIWFNQDLTEGPGSGQIGTGGTAAASSIVWGNLVGWTISGYTWCHAMPSFVCDFASGQDSETTDPVFLSSNFDMGTWTFHGTGWTMNLGYIARTSTTVTGIGNAQYFLRGPRLFDGTVPTVPLIGIGGVGLSVLALGALSMRRKRK